MRESKVPEVKNVVKECLKCFSLSSRVVSLSGGRAGAVKIHPDKQIEETGEQKQNFPF